MSILKDITEALVSLAAIIAGTICLALGLLLSIGASYGFVQFLRKLDKQLEKHQQNQKRANATDAGKPHDDKTVEVVVGVLAAVVYFFGVVVNIGFGSVVYAAVRACVIVVGVAIGLGVVAAMCMGLLGFANRPAPRASSTAKLS